MKSFNKFLIESGLHMFDVDDTLFHTTAKIHVVNSKTGETAKTLDNSEFNTHTIPDGHHYDFSEFRNADKFHKESKPIHKMIGKIKKIHANVKDKPDSRVILNTARADFDDKDKFLNKFRDHGIDIDNIHVERAGNIPGDEHPSEKKAQVVRNHLARKKYKNVHLYDDSLSNLKRLQKMKHEYPDVKFHAHHVQPDGSVKKLKDE
jgi:FMN phosphatase YigB (HAD superfamily)